MNSLAELLQANVPFLIHAILGYAKANGFTKYTSTLEEAWRLSIVGLNESIVKGIEDSELNLAFGPDENKGEHPLTRFGIIEAQRHKSRGVTLYMFLSLFKYYRRSYLDLLEKEIQDLATLKKYQEVIHYSFDSIEMAFCSNWNETDKDQTVQSLQDMNRVMTNEKNAFLTIFESLNDPIIAVDFQGRIEKINNAAVALVTGHSVPGAVHHHAEISSKDDKTKKFVGIKAKEIFGWLPDEFLSMDEKKRENISREIVIPCQNQSRIFDVNVSKMLDVSEKSTAIILNFRDITEIKKDKHDLEVANDTKNKFFSIISHDLVAPFNIILGFCDLLKENYQDCSDEDRKLFINSIYNTSTEALQLTKNILEWSRTQSGRVHLSPEKYDFKLVLDEILSLLIKQAQKKDINLSVEKVPSVAFWGDLSMVQTILRNLISNAIKFTHAGGLVEVVVTPLEKFIEVQIKDTGTGIAEENLKKLFKADEKFQLSGTAKEKGTGLGLLICHEFVKLNHGEIRVESEIGKGSSFIFTLPLEKTEK